MTDLEPSTVKVNIQLLDLYSEIDYQASNIQGYWSQEEEEEKSSPGLRYPQEKSEHRLPAALRTESGRRRSEFAVILDEDIFVVDD
ncbi:unnamed protein product [Allacma fusca]|uniref:Uncharacterized protein n=1 Tax=Allacma fusca TaxID=39272 RepID=A0A8J2NLY9_9HEXA|nr:unnamed protein product [Allacma fusca]